MQDIYNYIVETNRSSGTYSVAAIVTIYVICHVISHVERFILLP
jgi:hypothetical protein